MKVETSIAFPPLPPNLKLKNKSSLLYPSQQNTKGFHH